MATMRSNEPGLFAHVLWALGFFVIVCAVVAPLAMVVRADGRVDYCYVDDRMGGVALIAHRPWRPDHIRGLFPSAEQAAAAAKAMECPVR